MSRNVRPRRGYQPRTHVPVAARSRTITSSVTPVLLSSLLTAAITLTAVRITIDANYQTSTEQRDFQLQLATLEAQREICEDSIAFGGTLGPVFDEIILIATERKHSSAEDLRRLRNSVDSVHHEVGALINSATLYGLDAVAVQLSSANALLVGLSAHALDKSRSVVGSLTPEFNSDTTPWWTQLQDLVMRTCADELRKNQFPSA